MRVALRSAIRQTAFGPTIRPATALTDPAAVGAYDAGVAGARASGAARRGWTMRLGVAGLGRMGRAMAESLGGAESPVLVWNRTPGRANGLPGSQELHSPRA